MSAIGFNKPLYILPFDHRGSFQTKMFGWTGTLSAEQTAEISAAKRVVYDGFKSALQAGVPERKAGILVDEQFGAAILRDARAADYTTACPAEKSGQEEFDFEYGENFAKHIEAIQPTFCKVLVRYNPEGDPALNRRQAERLKRLSDYLHTNGRSKFMFELLVPPEKSQLDHFKGDKKAYDLELRPRLMAETISELQNEQVEADVWKIEGLDRREDCEKIVAVARRGKRDAVGCIIRRLACEEDHARGCRRRNRPPLPGICGHFREGSREDSCCCELGREKRAVCKTIPSKSLLPFWQLTSAGWASR